MPATASDDEITIQARILSNGSGRLPAETVRYFLNLAFSDRDKARMHDLAVRNEHDRLSAAERDELIAYAKAGTLLSILKSKARRALRVTQKKRSAV